MDDLPGLEPAKGIPGIDFVLKSADNEGNYVVDEVIKMGEKEPLFDTSHEHIPVYDGDIMGDTVSVKCEVCPIGWYIPIDQAREMGYEVVLS